MSIVVKIPYSRAQWDALVDSCLYGHPYGFECGEHEYIAEEMLKLGHTKYKYVSMDDKNYFHVLEVDGIQT